MTRTTEQEGQQGVDDNGMGHATASASASASSSAMTASGRAGGTSGSISSLKLHSNIFYVIYKLIWIVHPDQFAINTVGFRMYYASVTCSALISQCIAVVLDDKEMTAQKMPGTLITPFAANRNAQNCPPSDFEFAAAEIACTHLGEEMPSTNIGGGLPEHET
jgi:hypothetical protein